MKLTDKQRFRLLHMSGYLDGVLEIERNRTGKEEAAHKNDVVYNAILVIISSIELLIKWDSFINKERVWKHWSIAQSTKRLLTARR